VVNTLPGNRYALVSWTPLTAAVSLGSVYTGYLDWSPSLGSASSNGLVVGNYVVAFGASDQTGKVSYCVFRISVVDNEPPVFANCPQSQTYNTGPSTGAIPTSWPSNGIFATDNYNIPNMYGVCTSGPINGSCPALGTAITTPLPVGVVSFSIAATDLAGNNAIPCNFSVTVVDNSPPVLTGCGTSLINTVTTAGLKTADISKRCPNFTATDNIGVTSIAYTSTPSGYNCSTPIPITYGPGVIITITASDAAGNTAVCFIVATVSDREAPVLSGCNPLAETPIPAVCDPGKPTAFVTLPIVTATDNSGNSSITVSSFPLNLRTNSSFPLGSSSVTYTAVDPTGNRASCSFRINVVDTQPPVIFGFPSLNTTTYTYQLITDPGVATGRLTLPNITATDNVNISTAGFSPSTYTINNAFNFFTGTTVLTYNAYDTTLNLASATLFVTVTDNQKPTFVGCPSTIAQNATIRANTTLHAPNALVTWASISATDNVDGSRVLITQSSLPTGYTSGSLFYVGTTTIIYRASDIAGNANQCFFNIVVQDYEPPTMICPDSVTTITNTPYIDYAEVFWSEPIVTDNVGVVGIQSTYFQSLNYTVGTYNVTIYAWDAAGNNASCSFSFTVEQEQLPAASTAASSATSTFAAAGGGGGVLILLLILVIVIVVMRRNTKKKLEAATSGYAELMAMSDEFIVERARAIQQALVEQRQSTPPIAVTGAVIHPERKFAPPPTGLAELEEYMRQTVCKEIPRELLEFGAELGSGEFGAVVEGYYLRPALEKLKVAIKTLRKATTDDDKVKFLKEAAIMAQFNHPNIASLTGVCTLPPNEPTLIVLEYMHLGALQGYLQSPMVYDQLETLTMVRMALDVGAGMQYLAEAGFVHRDLAARNVLLDKTMTRRVADFGLSVDLASAEGGSEAEGVYAGTEGAKIPIRWTAIEAVCFRQFSSASDVWSFGILLWEIWSYADMPYKGWNNKKVTEEVSNGYRLHKPPTCPDEVYKIMIECWNKNVKRRITFPKINQALVETWKDISSGGGDQDEEEEHDNEEPDSGNLYDSTAQKVDLSDDEDDAPAPARAPSPDPEPEVQPQRAPSPEAEPQRAPSPDAAPVEVAAPAPVVESAYQSSKNDEAIDQPKFVVISPNAGKTRGEAVELSEADVGKRVTVVKFGVGTLRFFGPHHRDGKPRCGVELDEANGINNGTVGEFKYFECELKKGVLVDPRMVSILDQAPAAVMLNPIYESTPSQPQPPPSGYLSIGATDD